MSTFLTLERASEEWGVNRETLRLWCQDGTVPADKLGGLWMIDVEGLREQMRRRFSGTAGRRLADGNMADRTADGA